MFGYYISIGEDKNMNSADRGNLTKMEYQSVQSFIMPYMDILHYILETFYFSIESRIVLIGQIFFHYFISRSNFNIGQLKRKPNKHHKFLDA